MVGAHAERAAGNPDHVVGPAIFRWPIVPLRIVGPQQRHGAHSRRTLTDRRPKSPASGSDRCSTSSNRAPAASRPKLPRSPPLRLRSPRRCDRAARTPVVVGRTYPAAGTRRRTGTHHAPRRTTVRLAAPPRGPTTVVRRTAPPRRTTTSVTELSCLSCFCSDPACASDQRRMPASAVMTRPANKTTRADCPAGSLDGRLRSIERLLSNASQALSIAALGAQPHGKAISQPLFHILRVSRAQLLLARHIEVDAAEFRAISTG